MKLNLACLCQVQALLQDLFGIRLSLVTLPAQEGDAAHALGPTYAELAAAVPQAAVLRVNKTRWCEEGRERSLVELAAIALLE